ncbi:GNAT family N-acetyltransferase [Rhodococcus aerolatus]
MPIAVEPLSRADMTGRLPEALAIYVAAMGYPRGTEAQRSPVWESHTLRPGWSAVAAVETGPGPRTLRGIAYGYRGSAQQWWGGQVRAGLVASGRSPAQADAVMDDYFELTELHVSPDAQGRGLGDALLAALLDGCDGGRVLLSTPEVRGEANRAWRLYRRRGFTDLLRGFTFAGDPRPFAVLARDLPL